jgi:hypothetical protein
LQEKARALDDRKCIEVDSGSAPPERRRSISYTGRRRQHEVDEGQHEVEEGQHGEPRNPGGEPLEPAW